MAEYILTRPINIRFTYQTSFDFFRRRRKSRTHHAAGTEL
jgi:hypothetical protein